MYVLTDLECIDGQGYKVGDFSEVVRATGRGANLIVGRYDEQKSDVFVELNGLVTVELMSLRFVSLDAEVVEKCVNGRKKSLLERKWTVGGAVGVVWTGGVAWRGLGCLCRRC